MVVVLYGVLVLVQRLVVLVVQVVVVSVMIMLIRLRLPGLPGTIMKMPGSPTPC